MRLFKIQMPGTFHQGFSSLDLDLNPEIYILISLAGDSDTTKHWGPPEQPAPGGSPWTMSLCLQRRLLVLASGWAKPPAHPQHATGWVVSAVVCLPSKPLVVKTASWLCGYIILIKWLHHEQECWKSWYKTLLGRRWMGESDTHLHFLVREKEVYNVYQMF